MGGGTKAGPPRMGGPARRAAGQAGAAGADGPLLAGQLQLITGHSSSLTPRSW